MQYLYAFLCGGALCVIAQILIDKTKVTGARILVGYVVAGVLLQAIGVYKPFVEFAGAGASVPLTGFGSLLASGAAEAVQKDGLWGALYGGMSSAAAGISAALVFALLWAMLFKSRKK